MYYLFIVTLFLLNVICIFSSVSNIDGDYWFPFPTVSMNYSNDSIIDMSYLNWKIEEKVIIKEGHYYYKGKRVKFFGTNIAYDSCFPEKEDSMKIAKRLAQLGINLIRFHSMDNEDIWGRRYYNNVHSIMDENQLDKLHYFLYCLKSNGIYANLNMHVTRNYPEIFYDQEILKYFMYGKGIDRFYPSLIREQLNYIKDLLGSYNNYTGYKLGDDPMILNIELNNENSIYNLEDDSKINGMNDGLRTELTTQWRNFIKNKYKSYEEIDDLYNNETIDYSKDLVENNKIYCQKSGSECTIQGKLVQFNVTVLSKESWGNQIHFGLINISNFTTYTIEFDEKVGNGTEIVNFYFQENKTPYRNYLRIGNIKLNTEFQHFTFSGKTAYNIQFSENAGAVVEIILPPKINLYEVKNLKIYKGKAYTSFTENNEKNIDKILYPNSVLIQNLPNMAYDLRLFFYYTECNTQKNITNFIRNDLNFKNLYIVDSQVNYGIFFSYVRENDNSDLIDMHAYWDHPKFPNSLLWKRQYYFIKNSPMIKSKTFGTFNGISKGKIFNKPYSISEYNHPFPNEFANENFAMYGSWSAYHDYDAIYQFSYDQAKNEDYITRYFKMSSNPVDFAMAPYIALAFRKN